jgi:prephenate dehydrogenase
VGSVKGGIVDALESEIPDGVFFVGAHPIAGSERSGIDFASADLFRDALCILTPTENTDAASLKTIESLWKKMGAQVMKFSPREHDGIFSSVSHMPHVAAYALVSAVDEINPEYMSFAGQGFKDATRIALSSPEMWVDICRFNKDNIAHHLDVLIENLNTVKRFLKKNDYESLGEYFSRARKSRESLGSPSRQIHFPPGGVFLLHRTGKKQDQELSLRSRPDEHRKCLQKFGNRNSAG